MVKRKGIFFWIGVFFIAWFFLGLITILLGLASHQPVSSLFGESFIYLIIGIIFLGVHYLYISKRKNSVSPIKDYVVDSIPQNMPDSYSKPVKTGHLNEDYEGDYESRPKECVLCGNRIRGRTKYCSVCRPTGKVTAMPIEERERKRLERQEQKMEIWQRKEDQKQIRWLNKQSKRYPKRPSPRKTSQQRPRGWGDHLDLTGIPD